MLGLNRNTLRKRSVISRSRSFAALADLPDDPAGGSAGVVAADPAPVTMLGGESDDARSPRARPRLFDVLLGKLAR